MPPPHLKQTPPPKKTKTKQNPNPPQPQHPSPQKIRKKKQEKKETKVSTQSFSNFFSDEYSLIYSVVVPGLVYMDGVNIFKGSKLEEISNLKKESRLQIPLEKKNFTTTKI